MVTLINKEMMMAKKKKEVTEVKKVLIPRDKCIGILKARGIFEAEDRILSLEALNKRIK